MIGERGRMASLLSCRYEISDKPVFLLIVFSVQIAENTENDRTDQIDQQILHCVSDSYIEIASVNDSPAGAAGIIPAFYDCTFYVANMVDITIFCTDIHAVYHLYNPVFLHIQPHKAICIILKELPKDTDGHGKAESHYSKKQRSQIDTFSILVQQIDERKTDACSQKTVERVKRRVPGRYITVEITQLAENCRTENEYDDDKLQKIWNDNVEDTLDKERNGKEGERQCKYENISPFLHEYYLIDKIHNSNYAKHDIHRNNLTSGCRCAARKKLL